MICYLDASALVKRYVAELGSSEVEQAIANAEAAGTTMISRVEVVAAFGRAFRVGALSEEDADAARRAFHSDWPDFTRLHVTEFMTERAALLAWDYGLRGYDAVQMAAALTWQEVMGESVRMMTFDRRLWAASEAANLTPLPDDLPSLLASWSSR